MSAHNEVQVELSDQHKVVSLFQFVKELNKLKQKVVLNYSEYPWARTVSSFPNDPDNISVFYRDRVENDDVSDGTSVLLSVHSRISPTMPIFSQGNKSLSKTPLGVRFCSVSKNGDCTIVRIPSPGGASA